MSTNICHSEGFDALKQLTSQNPSWWSRRTKLERMLCFITVVCLFIFCAMVLVLSISGYKYLKYSGNSGDSVANLCLTPGCVEAAAEVLRNIDENVDPCTDFYQFACGGWMNRHNIPEDKEFIAPLDTLRDELFIRAKGLLEKKLENSDPPYVKKIKDMYNMCMDLDTIEKVGAEPLKEVLSIFGGWPVIVGNKWKQNKFDWLGTLIHFQKLGYNHNVFFKLSVDVDKQNTAVHLIKLETPILNLPDRRQWIELGLNDTTMAAYYKKMVEAAKYLGADGATAENELMEALQFEMTLANYSASSDEDEENFTRSANKYTIKELQDMIPQIPWLKYFKSLFSDEIFENDTLAIHALEYLKTFAQLVSTTEKRVVANYMLWKAVDESLTLLSKELRDIQFEYRNVEMGEEREKHRYMQCLYNTFIKEDWNSPTPEKIEIALSSYYFRHYFDEKSEDVASEIAVYVHQEFLSILNGTKWMDEITKAHAKSKARNIKIILGYPKELLNETLVNDFFSALSITNDSFYGNIFRTKKWATDYEYSQLRRPHVKGDWKNYAELEIEAFVEHSEITIQIIGMFQKPFFSKDRPYYMNFGSFGSVIGHEITHGFDNKGKMYDKDGNVADWWEPTSHEQFQQKAQCIVEQYSNYTTETGIRIDGKYTEAENIADNGGLKEAYLAYLSWTEVNEPEKLLPGLKYNQKQLFWISHAHISCAKFRAEWSKDVLIDDSHSPHKFRVIGAVSNREEFAKDFNCPLDSPMNKQPKCQVW